MSYSPTIWVDEILSDDERYTLLDGSGNPLDPALEEIQINLATAVTTPGTPINATALNNMEAGIVAANAVVDALIWTAWTPTITTATGSGATFTKTAKWMHLGKLAMVNIDMSVTAKGTGDNGILITLPFTPAMQASLSCLWITSGSAQWGPGYCHVVNESGWKLIVWDYKMASLVTAGNQIIISGAIPVA
jgi:hypothetical protein